MKKFILLIILIVAAVYLSYKNSYFVHTFIVKKYYQIMYLDSNKLYNESLLIKKEKSNGVDYINYLERMMLAFPKDKRFSRDAGRYYLEKGEVYKGIKYSLSSLNYDNSDLTALVIPLEIMIEQKMYGDLEELLSHYDKQYFESNGILAFSNGLVLFNNKRFDDALRYFSIAAKYNYKNRDFDYYTGLTYYEKSVLENEGKNSVLEYQYLLTALTYQKKAYDDDPSNNEYATALVKTYNRLGLFKEAEKILTKHKIRMM